MKTSPPHPITSLYLLHHHPGVRRILPELVVDVTAAREGHGKPRFSAIKSQMKTRNYLDLVMSRARTLGAAVGVEYAVGLWAERSDSGGISLGDLARLSSRYF